jgi:hypothetical protein
MASSGSGFDSSGFRGNGVGLTSSMKIIDGSRWLATANSALTIFSPWPTHFEVRADAEMLKNLRGKVCKSHFGVWRLGFTYLQLLYL